MEDEILHIFLRGLSPHIRPYVRLQRPATVDTALSLAQEEQRAALSVTPALAVNATAVQNVLEQPPIFPEQALPVPFYAHSRSVSTYVGHVPQGHAPCHRSGPSGHASTSPLHSRRRKPGPRPGRGNRIRSITK